jgi:hypothetical protein
VLVEERDLAELAELQDVVLENAILLPLLEAGVLEVGGERRISSAARVATFWLPATTVARVPRCSVKIETMP